MQGRKNREWLIKSSEKILGPYTLDEIAQGIASREFIVVDEVCKKFSRWKYLRDEEAFEKIIIACKNKEYSKNEKTFTDTDTKTQTGDSSERVVSFSNEGLISNVEEHLKEKEADRIINKQTSDDHLKKEAEAVKNYTAESTLKKKNSQNNYFIRFLIVLTIVCVAGAIFFLDKKEKILSYDDLKKIAYDNINYGNFDEAKIFLEKALAVNATNEELKYLLSYVCVELGDGITAQRLLTDLSNTSSDEKLKSQAKNLNGILQIKNFNLKDAEKSFKESLAISPKFAAAAFNLGATNFLDNKFVTAYENFTQSLMYGGQDGNILLSMVELKGREGLELKQDPIKRKQAEDMLNLISRQSENISAYKQELKIASAYLYFILGNNESMQKKLDEAIDVDPTLTTDHANDAAYYKGLVTWDKMSEWIKKMRDANPENENLRTLYGYALFKGADKLKGKDVIEGLLKSNYSNTSNQIIQAYILMTLKRDDEARAALAPIMLRRDKSLSFVLMGKLCLLKKDYPCADLNFSEALRIDKTNITALAGLSVVYFEQKDYKKSKELMNQVYRISSTYKPLMSIKQRLEKLKE